MKYLHIPFIKGELWRRYPKLPNRYCVSDHGRVLSLHTAKLIKTSKDKYGYERMSAIIGSRTDKTRKTLNLKIHQMVAETFLRKPNDPTITVNHIDFDKTNNKVENLEWVTSSENYNHAKAHGAYKEFTMLGRKHTDETKAKLSLARKAWHYARKFNI